MLEKGMHESGKMLKNGTEKGTITNGSPLKKEDPKAYDRIIPNVCPPTSHPGPPK